MKIFAMNDCDWMAGEDLESCIQKYLADYAGSQSRDDALDDARELSGKEMDRLKFCDEDGTKRTFREQLDLMVAAGEQFPTFFASTEY
jgi:hypothetical protein